MDPHVAHQVVSLSKRLITSTIQNIHQCKTGTNNYVRGQIQVYQDDLSSLPVYSLKGATDINKMFFCIITVSYASTSSLSTITLLK